MQCNLHKYSTSELHLSNSVLKHLNNKFTKVISYNFTIKHDTWKMKEINNTIKYTLQLAVLYFSIILVKR